MTTLTLHIPGRPVPQGSKQPFFIRRNGRIQWRGNVPKYVMVDSSSRNKPGKPDRLKAWKNIVAAEAKAAWRREPIAGAFVLRAVFLIERPKKHYLASGALRPDAPEHPIGKPDATKLFRAVEDALAGVVYTEDAHRVGGGQGKRYCGPNEGPGVHIYLRALETAPLYQGSEA